MITVYFLKHHLISGVFLLEILLNNFDLDSK